MIRYTLAAVCHAGLFASAAVGAPIQLIVGSPEAYVPGDPVTIEVRLPDLSNLGAYNIDLALESNMGAAGVDYYFDVAATMPAATNYVFPSSASYFDAVTVDSPLRHRITLTDFVFSGVNVAAGANDRVATVVFRTAPTFHGPLSIYVDAPLLILDGPGAPPNPVPGFSLIQTDVAAADRIELKVVPEPSSLPLCAVILVTIRLRGRRRGYAA